MTWVEIGGNVKKSFCKLFCVAVKHTPTSITDLLLLAVFLIRVLLLCCRLPKWCQRICHDNRKCSYHYFRQKQQQQQQSCSCRWVGLKLRMLWVGWERDMLLTQYGLSECVWEFELKGPFTSGNFSCCQLDYTINLTFNNNVTVKSASWQNVGGA